MITKFPVLFHAFVLTLVCTGQAPAQTITRGPYLQLGTDTSIIIRWRTDLATDSKVWYGTSVAALNQTVTDGSSQTDHEVQISGLTANTTYYYAVGNDAGQL